MPTQLLIDGHSLLFRAYHALRQQNLQTKDGKPTGAIHGLLSMVIKVITGERPDRVILAYDGSQKTFRHNQYLDYKANRAESPDEFRQQVPVALDIIRHLGIPTVMVEGFEADDVIGTLTMMGKDHAYRTFIVTGDRDLLQLVDDDVTVLLTTRTGISDLDRMDAAKVTEKMGVGPSQVPDFKGLMGDSSDNIPGVRGIGEQSAKDLLRCYGTIEEIIRHLPEMDNKRWVKALSGHEEDARTFRDLATIVRNVPLEWPVVEEPFSFRVDGELIELLDEWELQAIKRRLVKTTNHSVDESSRGIDSSSSSTELAREHWVVRWDQLSQDSPYLTVWLDERERELWAMDHEGRIARYVGGAWPKSPLWTWDSKRLYHFWLKEGTREMVHAEDGKLQSYLLDAENGKYDLNSVASRHNFRTPVTPPECLITIEHLIKQQAVEIEKWGLDRLYRDVELPLSLVLAEMEEAGMYVDRGQLQALGKELDVSILTVQREIYELAEMEFNINSPQQLGDVLFVKLNLPSAKKTKTGGYSTDAETLEKIAPLHPIVEKILFYRQLMKIKGTYVDGVLPLIESDNRVHTTFHQTGTATGRLSSSDPNLQNIPVRLPLGRHVRSVFVPSRGRTFLAADYSQIELRILAHLSGDEHLIEAFWHGEDIHRRTAAEIFNIPMDQVDSTWRNRAKAVNFGIVYGISDFGLARDTGVSQHEAKEYIARYFSRYPRLKEYFDDIIERARREGIVRTVMGRIRPLGDIHSRNRARRQYAERMAMNTAIQGSAADLIKIAMVTVYEACRRERFQSQLVLQVHDELIWDAVDGELGELAEVAERSMTQAMSLKVPLIVEFKKGHTWEDLAPWKRTV
ncbi:MAG: DNA polymerase I [Sulfobacillus benefaciens]|uniref:DNA polymerase I n=1 Tax=Sulfobacillus benefaciens TaxID=453960 RepID=A0A2T2X8D6_9FIRM|nr:MAG: DNA polymerase I [Sulfobacillus benefaciens]